MATISIGLSFTSFPRPSDFLTDSLSKKKFFKNYVFTGNIKSAPTPCEATNNHLSNPSIGSFFPGKSLMDYEDKVEKIKRLLTVEEDPIERLMFVDAIQMLGVAHHFQKEIHTILNHHYTKNGESIRRCYSLHDVALSFRLFRQRGFLVSPDVFNNFKGKDGRFKGEIMQDSGGLLELYEATQLSFEGENILDEAEEFCNQLLSQSNLSTTVNKRLSHPNYHKSITTMTGNNNFLRHLENTKRWGKTLTELAKMDFAVGQSVHQQELHHVSMWWEDVGLTRELKLARNQPLKWYTWSMAILIHDINLSWQKVQLTKCIAIIYLIDDIFDLYGTPQELEKFTEAVGKWEYGAMEMLPEYMKMCYKALVDTTNDMSDVICEKHGYNPINSLQQTWGSLCKAFLVEAKWFASKELPKAEEYLANGKVSSGVHVVLVHLFFLLGLGGTFRSAATAIHLNDTSTLISCVAAILRLWDDLGSAKDEHQDGKDGSFLECYMQEHQDLTLKQTREHVMKMIRNEWKRLNKECFNLNNSASESSFQEASLNLARMVSLMYSYDGNQRLPILEEYINFMLIDQPPMEQNHLFRTTML
ncbi:hypothetical protein ACS0TY_018486 [Phlomoides rotata]